MKNKIRRLRGMLAPVSGYLFGMGVAQVLHHRVTLGVVFMGIAYLIAVAMAIFG